MAPGVWTGVGFSNLKIFRTRIQKFWYRSEVGVWKCDYGHLCLPEGPPIWNSLGPRNWKFASAQYAITSKTAHKLLGLGRNDFFILSIPSFQLSLNEGASLADVFGTLNFYTIFSKFSFLLFCVKRKLVDTVPVIFYAWHGTRFHEKVWHTSPFKLDTLAIRHRW